MNIKTVRLVISGAVLVLAGINCYEEYLGIEKMDYIIKTLDIRELDYIVDNYTTKDLENE